MTDEERLRVQNSISVSIALISFAGALIAGAVAAFITIGDKVKPGILTWVLIGIVLVAIFSLLLSIFFGGQGIKATNDTIKDNSQTFSPAVFPKKYDGGNFERQVLYGIAGLLLGALAFIGLSGKSIVDHAETPESNSVQLEIGTLKAAVDKTRAEIVDTIKVAIRALKAEIGNDASQDHTVKAQGTDETSFAALSTGAAFLLAGISLLLLTTSKISRRIGVALNCDRTFPFWTYLCEDRETKYKTRLHL